MMDGPDIAEIAALIGEPARARMLSALTDGRAFSAGELAEVGGVTAQTASGHLARLATGGLVAVARQGRHRYYRLASPEVAAVLEAMEALAPTTRPRRLPGPREAAMRACRSCYDHLAGQVGVALADALVARDWLSRAEEGFALTDPGTAALTDFGLDLAAAKAARRHFAPGCLDWSERRPHLGGALGAALMGRVEALGWIARQPGARVVRITGPGRQGLAAQFGVDLDPTAAA